MTTRDGVGPVLPEAGNLKETNGMRSRRVAIFGLGLIGASLARDLHAPGLEISGYDPDDRALRAALEEGVLRFRIDPPFSAIQDYEMIIIATPVGAALRLLRDLAPCGSGARLITDVGSVKRPIVNEAQALGLSNFVGSHPLAGDHRSGWGASREGLFRGATVFLCPGPAAPEPAETHGRESEAASGAPPAAAPGARPAAASEARPAAAPGARPAHPLAAKLAIEEATRLWETVGARPELVECAAHDCRMALASHLPQVVASALGRILGAAGLDRSDLGPGGRDMTRLAGSRAAVWTDIALQNADQLSASLKTLDGELAGFRAALAAGDEAAVRAFFATAEDWFAETDRRIE